MSYKYIGRRIAVGVAVVLLIGALSFAVSRYSLINSAEAEKIEQEQSAKDKLALLKSVTTVKPKVAESKQVPATPPVQQAPVSVDSKIPVITKVEFKLVNDSTYYLHGILVNGLAEQVSWPLIEVSLLTKNVVVARQIVSTVQYLAGNKLQGVRSPLNIPPNGAMSVSVNLHYPDLTVKPDNFRVRVFYKD